MKFNTALTAAALASVASAQSFQGFNYGSTFTTGAAKQQSDFEAEFKAAQGLQGHTGFTSARIYTMIQAGTANTPISAIPAAIATKTTLLLGLWASAGQANIDNEITALNAAIKQYGTAFTSLIAGISVGSEDLYRITPTGIQNKAGIGAGPAEISSYLQQVRANVSSSVKAPIGHVDTWTAWVNGSNSAVIQNSDFLGVDGYPYFETVNANSIDNGASLFFQSYQATQGVSGGKPVWVTETGWPVSGPLSGQAVASIENAKRYWDDVACKILGTTNTWWFTLQDAQPDTPSPSFGLVGAGNLGTNPKPLYDLTCPKVVSSSSAAGSGTSSSTPVVVQPASSSSAATSIAVQSSSAAPVSSSAAGASSSSSVVLVPVPAPSSSRAAEVSSSSVPVTHSSSTASPSSTARSSGGAGSSSATPTARSSGSSAHATSTQAANTAASVTVTQSSVSSTFTGAAATVHPGHVLAAIPLLGLLI